ncbi:hypothetical protein DCO48_01635 [Pseudomonas sp. SDI]|nr:hypothetical protein DCO48_01635 [Pseudomonas sp. SDI]
MAGSMTIAGNQPTSTALAISAAAPENGALKDDALRVDASQISNPGKAAEAKEKAEAAASSEPPHIKQMREQVKRLQKQLEEDQKALAQAMASKGDETTKAVRVMAAQAAVATTSGQLLQATAALLQALTEAGGSSAGSAVSTTA